jgi:RNA methyltransferase, TrmH family
LRSLVSILYVRLYFKMLYFWTKIQLSQESKQNPQREFMISKNKISYFKSFHQKKMRDTQAAYIAEGTKLVCEAIENGCNILHIVARESWIAKHQKKITQYEVIEASAEELAKISLLQSPQEVWALISYTKQTSLPELRDIVFALDCIQDPGNMGTIIRIANWFGVEHILCSPDCVDMYNPKVVQASMGAIFRTSIYYCNLIDVLNTSPIPVYGTFLDGKNIYETALPPEAIIVFGNEGNGISVEVAAYIHQKIHIPSFTHTKGSESLNVSVAAGITCAEFMRQKHLK